MRLVIVPLIETAEGDKQLPDLLERACAPVGSSRLEKQPRVVVYACAIIDSIAGRASTEWKP
jgi:hypothetical protein